MLAAPSISVNNPLENLHAVVLAFLEANVPETEARLNAARAPSQINKHIARSTKVEPLSGCSQACLC